MANEQKAKTEKATKETKEIKYTAVDFLKQSAVKGAKTKEAVVARALDDATKRNVTVNSKGNKLNVENLTSLLNAMCRDIKAERGKGKNGWWSEYTIQDDEAGFKFIAKA